MWWIFIRLSIHNQTSIYAARVLSPIYGTVPCVYNRTLSVCFFRICREFWGVNRSVVVKSLNQVNKSRVNKEARYSVFAFSIIWKIYFFSPSCQHDWTFTLIMGRKFVFIVINKLISRPNVSRGAGYITQFSFRWLEVREHVSYSNGYGNAYKSDNRLLFERNMKESSANLRPRF